MPTFDIGAPGRWDLGTAATPTVLVDRTTWVQSVTIDRAMEDIDVTTLQPPNYARSFIPGLQGATGSFNYLVDSPGGAFYIVLSDIVSQRKSPSWRLRPFGTASGSLEITGTLMVTGLPLPVEFGTAVGGSVSFRISGLPAAAVQ